MCVREREAGGKGAFIAGVSVELLAQNGGIIKMKCIGGRGRSSKSTEHELEFSVFHDDLATTSLGVTQNT